MCTLRAHRQEDQGTHMSLGMGGEVVRLWPRLLPYRREARQVQATANSTHLHHLCRVTTALACDLGG